MSTSVLSGRRLTPFARVVVGAGNYKAAGHIDIYFAGDSGKAPWRHYAAVPSGVIRKMTPSALSS